MLKRSGMRRAGAIALLAGLAALLAAGPVLAADQFFGLGVFGGTQYHDDPVWHTESHRDWREISVRPVLGIHRTDRWDLWLEGNLGYIEWDDAPEAVNAGELDYSIEAGLMGMTSYDVLRYGRGSLYGELGAGVGWMSETPDTNLVDSGVLGFLDYGLGMKWRTEGGLGFKLGARFHHRSCLTTVDAGVNSYGVMLSVTK
jgi:hypothetical protein